jgi:hypothetical protein
MEKFRINIASLPDRERLVAEIIYEGIQWVEISYENEDPIIQFYPHPTKGFWEFKLDDALEALEKAKKNCSSYE